MKREFLTYENDQQHLKLSSIGEWMLNNVLQIEQELSNIPSDKKIIWDLSGISDFDSAGVLLFIEYLERFEMET
jgi:phospholipid/cholesterol/gamma-HCH transport system permease protein